MYCLSCYNEDVTGKYKAGDTIYIISAGKQIEEAKVLKYAGGFYTLKFTDGGGTKLRENRLFSSKEEALGKTKTEFRKTDLPEKLPEKKKEESRKVAENKTTASDKSSPDNAKQPSQIIIHVDMDAFYASVEQRDNPKLRGKPLIIGSLPNERGVVATCSYEARKYGVHSAMNIKEAYRLCPNGIYMHGNHEKYKRVSDQLHLIWNQYASVSEYLALDEAYLDVTETAKTFERACEFARIIKERTKKELGLNCSIGIAYSKTAAKMASEEKKPNGYFEIRTPEDFINLVIDRDVKVLYTVGTKTAEKLHNAGIRTVRDIQNNQDKVVQLLGKQGGWLYRLSYGIDDSKVTPYKPEDAKSISREFTFQKDVNDFEFLKDVLLLLSISVERRAKRYGLYGKGVTLKITYSDMKSITRSKQIESSRSSLRIYEEACKLLDKIEHKRIRLIGVGIHSLSSVVEGRQMSFDVLLSEDAVSIEDINSMLKDLGDRYGLNFIDNLDKVFAGETLYKTIEYMRKHRKS